MTRRSHNLDSALEALGAERRLRARLTAVLTLGAAGVAAYFTVPYFNMPRGLLSQVESTTAPRLLSTRELQAASPYNNAPYDSPRLSGPQRAPAPPALREATLREMAVHEPRALPKLPPIQPLATIAPREVEPALPRVAAQATAETLTSGLMPLARPTGAPIRGPQAASASTQAADHDRRGYELANRGAHYAARAEFAQALRTVAAGLDADNQSQAFGQALAAGLRALDEAEDFQSRRAQADGELDVAEVMQAHRTPVLKGYELASVTPATARQYYSAYAAQQLALAAGGDAAAAQALYCLGKLHGIFASQKAARRDSLEQRAVVYYQAALYVAPSHAMAANDLGVLLAERGCYDEARTLLSHSLAVAPHAAIWHNLAVVHQRLGQPVAAERARQAAHSAGGAALTNPALVAWQNVRWVDPTAFAATTQPATDLQRPAPTAQPATGARPTPALREARQRSWGNWLN